jgi:hypothetical protein
MFYLFTQQYYISPIFHREAGIGRQVIVEATSEQEALDILRAKGFDLEEECRLDPYSDSMVRVWELYNSYSSWEDMFCQGVFYCYEDTFIHLLDGRVIMGGC